MQPPPHDRERGSITAWAALSAFVMIVLVGIAVDLTGQVNAQQRVQSIAAQAARTGGQQLDAPTAIRGTTAKTDPATALAAARTYLEGSSVAGQARVVSGTRLVVDTQGTYQTVFLSIIGISHFGVSGHSEVRLVRAVEGVER